MNLRNKARIILSICISFWVSIIVLFAFCLPNPLFDDPYSTVVLDENGNLLGVRISDDGQWRFPETDIVSDKFETCILTFEDKRFYKHLGVDPFAMARAVRLNLSQRKVVSGGSTITMQVIRLSRKGKSRTFFEKGIEIFLATRLELSLSKKEILNLYASHAPFGGNIVGIEAAAWRYFGRSPDQLSWAENAMLAVLPNSPTFINTAKNRDFLKSKRDRLLQLLHKQGSITDTELELALEEPIPEHPSPYPMHSYHMVERVASEHQGKNSKVITTINIDLQKQANNIIHRFNERYSQNEINNIACLILDVETGAVKAYIGNGDITSNIPEKAVDMVKAQRSTGSILKPFLYSAILTDGDILPKTLLKDIPTKMGSFSPENFDRNFDGAVPADECLARSLNVPFVYMLKDFRIVRFLYILKSLGFDTIDKSSDHYGLSLILGGAESSLWDICSAYSSMARSLKHYTISNSRYNTSDYHDAVYTFEQLNNISKGQVKETSFLSASSIWWTFEAMTSVNRPGQEKMWRKFNSKQKVAWKTGTSFNFKDAWSVAVTPDYIVGVWVGNATGEGRAGIVGLSVAAPVLFEILNIIPDYKSWFPVPYDEMIQIPVCKQSGHIASPNCHDIDSIWIPTTGINSSSCPYHKIINLDQSGNYRVNSNCYPVDQMIQKDWFVLPPIMEAYYKSYNSWYQTLPPYLAGCEPESTQSKEVMELVYPSQLSRVLIPVELSGDTLPAVFKVAHRDDNAKIYWYIDTKYHGYTQDFHDMGFKLPAGSYTLNLMDDKGNKISKKFIVVERE